MNDAYWMQEALALAQKAATEEEVPIGALLVNQAAQVIGRGYNHPIRACDPTAHAEILALREAARTMQNYRLPGTTLYCTLEPCAMCAGALIQARVARVVFAAFDEKGGALVSILHLLDQPALNHRAQVQGGILQEASVKLLQHFFKQRRGV